MTDRARLSEGTEVKEIDAEDFFRLPLTARVRHVLDGTVVFLRDGAVVETRAYLADRRPDAPGRAKR